MSRESNDTWVSSLIYPHNTTQLEQPGRCYRNKVRTHHGSCRNSNTHTTRTYMQSKVHNKQQRTTVRPGWRCKTHTKVQKTTWHVNTVYGNDNVAATKHMTRQLRVYIQCVPDSCSVVVVLLFLVLLFAHLVCGFDVLTMMLCVWF